MKKLIALVLSLMMILSCASVLAESKGTLIMATNASFPPYEYYDGEVIVGIDAEIAAAVAEKLGLELKIEDMEFDSIITAVSTGKADMAASGILITDERAESVLFSAPYYDSHSRVAVLTKNADASIITGSSEEDSCIRYFIPMGRVRSSVLVVAIRGQV